MLCELLNRIRHQASVERGIVAAPGCRKLYTGDMSQWLAIDGLHLFTPTCLPAYLPTYLPIASPDRRAFGRTVLDGGRSRTTFRKTRSLMKERPAWVCW